ncbi:MAG: diaminopimelate decarboxylase [Elusimicrobiota bacterium]
MPRDFGYRKGRLCVENVPVERIARRLGTPVYIYSAKGIQDRYREYRTAFSGSSALICYALKANSNLAICRLLAGEGAGADVVSGGELLRGLRAGFRAGDIVFSGVGKTIDELDLALRHGVRAINVESAEELEVLAKLARRRRRRAPIAIRINPDVDAATHAHISTGRARDKFGVGSAAALELYRRAAADKWLEPAGIHCHIGSQITRLGPYRRALRIIARLLRRLQTAGVRLRHIDIGGGMGIAYGKGAPLSPRSLAELVNRELLDFRDMSLILEPGRSLVGEAGLLATKVLYRKARGRRNFVIVDAGMTDLLRPALYGARHEIVPVTLSRRQPTRVDIVGPVCESTDVFARGRKLPLPAAGDVLAVLQAGAYGFSMSSQYNSRPRAAEVLVSGSRSRIVRRRETPADLMRHEL